jgi:hypothetical protein
MGLGAFVTNLRPISPVCFVNSFVVCGSQNYKPFFYLATCYMKLVMDHIKLVTDHDTWVTKATDQASKELIIIGPVTKALIDFILNMLFYKYFQKP